MPRKLIAALCLSAGLLSSCSEGPEDAHRYLQKAQEQRTANRNDLAMVELRNALKLNPDLLPALELQLELFEDERNLGQIFALTDTILGNNPDHLAANLRRGELLLLSGDVQRSVTYVDRALVIAPNNIKALNLKTAQLIRSRDLEEAQALSDSILANHQYNATSYTLAGAIQLVGKNYPGAEEMAQQGLAQFPKNIALHQLKIQLASQQAQLEKIPPIYQELIAYYPQDVAMHQNLAIFFVQNEQQDQAIRTMRDATEKNPNNVDAKILLAQLIAGTGDDKATDLIHELVTAQPEASKLRFLLANLYRDAERYAEAAEQYQTIRERNKDDPVALEAQAELARQALEQGRPEEANALIDDILKVNNEHQTALLISAYRHLMQGDPNQAINALNTALRNQPDDDRALTLMGKSYLSKNFPDLARDSFVTAMQANPKNVLAAKHLATMYLQKQKYRNMIDVLKSFEHLSDADSTLLSLLLQARIQLKDWPAAERLTNHPTMKAAHPTLTDWVTAMAMQDSGEFKQSILKMRRVTETNPTRSGPARTLVNAYLQNQQADQAITYLKTIIASHPTLDWPGQLLVEVYLDIGETNQATMFLRAGLNSAEPRPYYYAYLARLELNEIGIEQALQTTKTGIDAFPKSVPLTLSYAGMLEQAGKAKLAAPYYEAVLALDANAEVAANNLAVIYSRSEATLDRAHQVAQRFLDSPQPYFTDTLGWICALREDYDCALKLLQKAVKLIPDQPEFNYHLGEAYRRAKQNENAKRYLQRSQQLVDEGNTFPGSENVKNLLQSVQNAS